MRTLIIDTATAACSVALFDGAALAASAHELVGRGHAERLVPMIAALPDQGRADAILVDCGPGSFTGVRIGIAAAIGLGIGWSVPVQGYSSLALVAAMGLAGAADGSRLAVVLEGGHGEVFMQCFSAGPFMPDTALASLKPEGALAALAGRAVTGNGVRYLSALDPMLAVEERLPDAALAMSLPLELRTLSPRPIYGRAPDAKLPG